MMVVVDDDGHGCILRFPVAARLSLSSFCIGLAVAKAALEVGLKDGESRASHARLRLAQRLMDGYVTLCMVCLWFCGLMVICMFLCFHPGEWSLQGYEVPLQCPQGF